MATKGQQPTKRPRAVPISTRQTRGSATNTQTAPLSVAITSHESRPRASVTTQTSPLVPLPQQDRRPSPSRIRGASSGNQPPSSDSAEPNRTYVSEVAVSGKSTPADDLLTLDRTDESRGRTLLMRGQFRQRRRQMYGVDAESKRNSFPHHSHTLPVRSPGVLPYSTVERDGISPNLQTVSLQEQFEALQQRYEALSRARADEEANRESEQGKSTL